MNLRKRGAKWAGLLLATLWLAGVARGSVFDNLRITEINYNPHNPTSAELAAGGSGDQADYEFIELYNTSVDETLNLTGVYLANGVIFRFPDDFLLSPQHYVLVVSDRNSFQVRYLPGLNIAGEFENDTNLSNGGETIELRTPVGQVIHLFTYYDDFPWPFEADSYGSTLNVIDTASDYSNPVNWRAGYDNGGTPGRGCLFLSASLEKRFLRIVEINYRPTSRTPEEIAAGLDNNDAFEFIELLNLSPTETLDLSGVRVTLGIDVDLTTATNTVLLPGQRVVLVRNPMGFATRYPGVPIIGTFSGGLSNDDEGEELLMLDASGAPIQFTKYYPNNSWPPEADGQGSTLEIIDHWYDFNNPLNWRASQGRGGGSPGAPPTIVESPEMRSLRITEIHYHPLAPTEMERNAGFTNGDYFEFIELQNIGACVLDLTDVRFSMPPWGFNLAMAAMKTLEPGQVALLVRNQAAFEIRYGTGYPVIGEYGDAIELTNSGEIMRLVDANNGLIQLFRYNDKAPWPETPDGTGPSLEVLNTEGDYNDPANWRASVMHGTPGATAVSVESYSCFVERQYLDFLSREAEPAGRQYYLHHLCGATMTPDVVVHNFIASPEFADNNGFIARCYFAIFNSNFTAHYADADYRIPDYGGMQYWNNEMARVVAAGGSFDDAKLHVIRGFTGSPEWQARVGALDNWGFVGFLYENILGRAAESAGQQFHFESLEQGRATREDLIRQFIVSPEAVAKYLHHTNVVMAYLGLLDREAEKAGFDYHMMVLETGQTDVVGFLNGFIYAPEYINRLATLGCAFPPGP